MGGLSSPHSGCGSKLEYLANWKAPVTRSKAPVTTSDALVPSSFLLLLVRHLANWKVKHGGPGLQALGPGSVRTRAASLPVARTSVGLAQATRAKAGSNLQGLWIYILHTIFNTNKLPL